MDLDEIGWGGMDWIVFQVRDKWRTLFGHGNEA
jgi:hypothetical protein